jgi:hypothetical protein
MNRNTIEKWRIILKNEKNEQVNRDAGKFNNPPASIIQSGW